MSHDQREIAASQPRNEDGTFGERHGLFSQDEWTPSPEQLEHIERLAEEFISLYVSRHGRRSYRCRIKPAVKREIYEMVATRVHYQEINSRACEDVIAYLERHVTFQKEQELYREAKRLRWKHNLFPDERAVHLLRTGHNPIKHHGEDEALAQGRKEAVDLYERLEELGDDYTDELGDEWRERIEDIYEWKTDN